MGRSDPLASNKRTVPGLVSAFAGSRLAAGVALAAILLVFFAPALAPGHMLSAAEEVLGTPFFAGSAPEGSSLATNSLLFDQVYQFTPWRCFAWKSLRAGSVPLWNPYSLAGTPFIGRQSAVAYTINLLLTPIPERADVRLVADRAGGSGPCAVATAGGRRPRRAPQGRTVRVAGRGSGVLRARVQPVTTDQLALSTQSDHRFPAGSARATWRDRP